MIVTSDLDRIVDCGADGAGGAVDVLERRGNPLQELDRALGRENLVFTGDFLDLGNSFSNALDRRL